MPWRNLGFLHELLSKFDRLFESVIWIGFDICGDLGINSKNSQPDIDSSAARYKMYKRVATHKAPRIHPVKIRKKKNNKM